MQKVSMCEHQQSHIKEIGLVSPQTVTLESRATLAVVEE